MAQAPVPDQVATAGGELNPAVTQSNVGETICRQGWSEVARRPASETEPETMTALMALAAPGYDADPRHYGWGPRVPIEVGGSPDDLRNLRLEPRYDRDGWDARRKGDPGRKINRMICSSRLTLELGQAVFLATGVKAGSNTWGTTAITDKQENLFAAGWIARPLMTPDEVQRVPDGAH